MRANWHKTACSLCWDTALRGIAARLARPGSFAHVGALVSAARG